MDYELMMNGNVRIGMQAPDFEADTTYGKICLSDYRGKWLIFFSHLFLTSQRGDTINIIVCEKSIVVPD